MRDPNEIAFLRSIAANDNPVARLVFADWLDDNGESTRAEFIRLQCELATPNLPEESRQSLRQREFDLLQAHRAEWIQAFGLPLVDVCFQGGLIAQARLADWVVGPLLNDDIAPGLASLKELDLSGLGLGDTGLALFSEKAQFPALSKLNLGNNKITETGVRALAKSTGMPRLETVYLFQNPAERSAYTLLKNSLHFKLKNLDVGEGAEGYCMSAGEAETARRQHIRTHLEPTVSYYFRKYKLLRSTMLCVAQYWDDEASDAVHGCLVVSELIEPTLEGISNDKTGPDVNIPNTRIVRRYERGSVISLWDENAPCDWEDNGSAISLWASFASEGGNQEYDELREVYSPAVLFYKHGGYQFFPMIRPHLEGIRPEREHEE